MNAASLIYTKAPKILAAHEAGPVIRARDGFWLAIPTDAAGKGARGRKLLPKQWEDRTGLKLRFVATPNRKFYLVADDARVNKKGLARRRGGKRRQDGILTGAQTVVIFTLLPQTRLRKKLNLLAAADRIAGQIPAMIVAAWPEV